MTTQLSPSVFDRFDPEEIRALVRKGIESGAIIPSGTAVPVEKEGERAAQLGGVRSLWMDVTPEMAAQWLKNNFRNRPMSEDVVAAYARDMIQGQWVPTHQGIAFNDRDELIDGQHRLSAIIVAHLTVRMMVTFGLKSEIEGREMTTMDAVDRGRTRSVADQLKIQHGMKDGGLIAMVTKSIGALCHSERTRRLSVGQTLEIYRAFEWPVRFVIEHRSKSAGLRVAGVLAGFAFALGTEEAALWGPIAQMFQRLNSGEELGDSPLSHLRDFLTSDAAKLLTRGTDRGVAELVLEAIYLESVGVVIEKLEMGTAGLEHFSQLQHARVQQIAAIFSLPQ